MDTNIGKPSNNILLIGPGGIGAVFQRLIVSSGDSLTAVISSTIDSGENYADKHSIDFGVGRPEVFSSVECALKNRNFNGVIVAAPASTHEYYLDEILPTYLPIICEKPLISRLDNGPMLQAEIEDTLLRRWGSYLKNHFVFNACNHHFMAQAYPESQVLNTYESFFFRFHTNGPHRYKEILADLLPHCVAFLLKRVGNQHVRLGEVNIKKNRCYGHFYYGSCCVNFDFAQSKTISKDLTFGFNGELYTRVQEGHGENYSVGLIKLNSSEYNKKDPDMPVIGCDDPFAISYRRFREFMALVRSTEAQNSISQGDLGWAITNSAICHGLLVDC